MKKLPIDPLVNQSMKELYQKISLSKFFIEKKEINKKEVPNISIYFFMILEILVILAIIGIS